MLSKKFSLICDLIVNCFSHDIVMFILLQCNNIQTKVCIGLHFYDNYFNDTNFPHDTTATGKKTKQKRSCAQVFTATESLYLCTTLLTYCFCQSCLSFCPVAQWQCLHLTSEGSSPYSSSIQVPGCYLAVTCNILWPPQHAALHLT